MVWKQGPVQDLGPHPYVSDFSVMSERCRVSRVADMTICFALKFSDVLSNFWCISWYFLGRKMEFSDFR